MCSNDQGHYQSQAAKDTPQVFDKDEGFCEKREDKHHCNCWWEGFPCCGCGYNGGHIDE